MSNNINNFNTFPRELTLDTSQVTITSSMTEAKHDKDEDLEYILNDLTENSHHIVGEDSADTSMIFQGQQKEEIMQSALKQSQKEPVIDFETPIEQTTDKLDQPQNFPDSYDTGAVFLKSLLDSFYLKRAQEKTQGSGANDRETTELPAVSESINESTQEHNLSSTVTSSNNKKIKNNPNKSSEKVPAQQTTPAPSAKQTNTCSSKKACQKTKCSSSRCSKVKSFFVLLILLVLSFGVYELHSDLTLVQEEYAQLQLKFANSSVEFDRATYQKDVLSEEVQRLKKKNAMLLRMADKVVEEEKRNCDFFDVYSIFTSTIGSKREKNLQDLCRSYYKYSELEGVATPQQVPVNSTQEPQNEATNTAPNSGEEEQEEKQVPLRQMLKSKLYSFINQVKDQVQDLNFFKEKPVEEEKEENKKDQL